MELKKKERKGFKLRLQTITAICNSVSDLIDSQVDAGVWEDAEHVGYIALVEGGDPLPLDDLFGAVCYSWELPSFS